MKINKNTEPRDGAAYAYVKSAIAELCAKHGIKQSQVLRAFGQTNPATFKRWKKGEDIYILSLIKMCNDFNFDPLSFVSYKGHRFATRMEDLARAEEAGIDIAALLSGKSANIQLPEEKEPTYKEQLEDYKYLCSIQKDVIEVLRERIAALDDELKNVKD